MSGIGTEETLKKLHIISPEKFIPFSIRINFFTSLPHMKPQIEPVNLI